VLARVQRDFRSGVRGGVVTTPTLFEFSDGVAAQIDADALAARLAQR
jgi:hypothetical protein